MSQEDFEVRQLSNLESRDSIKDSTGLTKISAVDTSTEVKSILAKIRTYILENAFEIWAAQFSLLISQLGHLNKLGRERSRSKSKKRSKSESFSAILND